MAMKECQKCSGSGFLTENRDGGVYARPCTCRKLNQKEMLVRGAGIPQRYREKCVFSEFKPNHESQRDALTIAKRYAEEYPALPGDRNGLLFLGPCGTGKTHLAVAILQDILFHSGLPGLFVDLNDLYREIRSSYDPGSEGTEYAILAPLVEAPLLLIDELGCVASPWAQDTLHGGSLAVTACTALYVIHLRNDILLILARYLGIGRHDWCFSISSVAGYTSLSFVKVSAIGR